MRIVWLVLAFVLVSTSATAGPRGDRIAFVSLVMEQLGTLERIRTKGEKEIAAGENPLASCVRNSTTYQLELASMIDRLKLTPIAGEGKDVRDILVGFFGKKIDVWRQIGDSCATMMAGPKPGVDYGAISANMPRLTAQQDFIDKSIFQSSSLLAAILIDEGRLNTQGKVTHFIVTRKQRDELVATIENNFGKETLDKKGDMPWYPAAGDIIRHYLTKSGFKCADET